MFQPGWLFIAQLLCLSAPLLFVAIVRPFEDWLKNVASVTVYCTSILAIIAPVCPETAQAPLGYLIVILMSLFCVAASVLTIMRAVLNRKDPKMSTLRHES